MDFAATNSTKYALVNPLPPAIIIAKLYGSQTALT